MPPNSKIITNNIVNPAMVTVVNSSDPEMDVSHVNIKNNTAVIESGEPTLEASLHTQDSWGQQHPAPMAKEASMERNDSDLSDPDELTSPAQDQAAGIATKEDKVEDLGELAPPVAHRSQSWCAGVDATTGKSSTPKKDDEDSDNVANYINMTKLFRAPSSDYAYSRENASTRKTIEKMASKKKMTRHASHLGFMDDSGHSKESMLSQRSSASAYRGPAPRMKNGQMVRGVMKKRGSLLSKGSSHGSVVSIDDLSRATGENKPITKANRNISFSSVDVREHERIAGDNPCVSSGVPLSIGWGYLQHEPISLDDYETYKGPARDKVEMMVPASVRKSMLREEFGVSIKDMNEAMKQVNITKRQRRHTVASEHLEGWTEVLQSAKRKFGRLVKGTSTDKEQQKLWEKAHKNAMSEYLQAKGAGSLGANPELAGAGEKGVGPLISAVEDSPPTEIEFNQLGGDDAPQF